MVYAYTNAKPNTTPEKICIHLRAYSPPRSEGMKPQVRNMNPRPVNRQKRQLPASSQ
jgi:hypothetical protein